MTENYPTSIDTYSTKVDNVTDVLADHVNTLQVAVLSLQGKVGIDSSSVVTSIDYIINNDLLELSNFTAKGDLVIGTGAGTTRSSRTKNVSHC